MHNSQEVAKLIKLLAKTKKISVGALLSTCELSKNTLSSMQSGGYYPRVEAICKIADYLDCSVDYLLGRTDDPTFVPRKVVKEFPHTKKRSSDAYIAAFGGNVHVPEDEETPRVAREIFEEARSEDEEQLFLKEE